MKIEKFLASKGDFSELKNKNIFITGSNSGIGFELANILASYGANIFLLCRNLTKAKDAKNILLNKFPTSKIEIIELDLASFASIKNTVEEIKKYDVDVFVNNAGVFRLPKSTTKDGYEVIMGTNLLGTLFLNDLLNDYFLSLNHKVKIVFTSSITSKMCRLNLNDFFMEKHYKKLIIYGRSKQGINSLFFNYLDENNNTNLEYSLVHPGATYTPLINKGYKNKIFEKAASIFMKIFFHSPKKASLSLLEGVCSKEKISLYGPRGLFGLSGYPHKWHVKKDKNYKKVIEHSRMLISEKDHRYE